MINLYAKNTTNFNNNGVATFEPTECKFSASINDVWKLEATIPYDKEGKYKLFSNDMIIKVTDMDGVAEQSASQLFRIYDYKKQDSSVYVLAYPVGLDARFDAFIQSLDLRGLPANSAISALSGVSDRYTVTTNKNNLPVKLSEESGLYRYTNLIAALNGDGGFTSLWGGEICYDNTTIKVNNALGSDNGAEVRYGKNLTSMTYDRDTSNVVTRLFPISNDGEWLNHVEAYKIANTAYVDSSKINNYPIPHSYAVTAPYTLVQLSDNKSAEYTLSTQILNDISDMVGTKVHELTDDYLSTTGMNWAAEWIKMFYPLTMDSDGTEGFAERIGRLVTANCASASSANLIKKGITAGFKGYFDSITAKRSWHKDGNNYICWQNEDISWHMVDAWAKDGTTWRRIGTNGVHQKGINATAKESDFKWFAPDKATYKRYGYKKKNYYIHASESNGYVMHQLNGVWYVFDYEGQGYKGTEFLNKSFVGLPNGFASLYDAIVDVLRPYISTWEGQLYNLLYTQMTAYCNNMFASQKIDDPVTNVTVNLVDLSQTTEYQNYQSLVKVRLGDTVRCINYKTGITSTERAIAIEYDVLRKCNTSVTLGTASNTVISILSSFGSDNGVRTATEETVVETPTAGVKDVYVNGESVVMGGIASIDLDLDSGLKYFVETENAFYGSNDYMEFIKDGRYAPDVGGLIYENENDNYITQVGVTLFPNHIRIEDDNRAVIAYVPQTMSPDDSYPLRIANIQYNSSGYGAILLLSNYIEFFNDLEVLGTYYSRNKSTGQESSSTGLGSIETFPAEHETTMICHVYTEQGSEMFYNAYICFASAEIEIDDETWYGLFIWKNGTIFNKSNYTSIQDYLPKSRLPHSGGNVVPYATLTEFVEQVIPLWNPADGSCNGIGKANNLAFFAGADDEYGTNAPVKIFTDGSYIGLDKIEDFKVGNVSYVTNKIAQFPLHYFVKDVRVNNTSITSSVSESGNNYTIATIGLKDNIAMDKFHNLFVGSIQKHYFSHALSDWGFDAQSGITVSTAERSLYSGANPVNDLITMTINNNTHNSTNVGAVYKTAISQKLSWIRNMVLYLEAYENGSAQAESYDPGLDEGAQIHVALSTDYVETDIIGGLTNIIKQITYSRSDISSVDWNYDVIIDKMAARLFPFMDVDLSDIDDDVYLYVFSNKLNIDIVFGRPNDLYKFYAESRILSSGGGGSSLMAIEKTQAQYDALPLSEKEDPNKIYFIKD